MKSKKTLKSIAFCLVWIFLLSAAALPAAAASEQIINLNRLSVFLF